MKKLIILVLAIGVVGLIGMTGCKNVCQKAGDHMMGCIEQYCGDHEDSPMCTEEALNEMREESAEGGECGEAEAAAAEGALQLTCEQITAPFAAMEALGAPPE